MDGRLPHPYEPRGDPHFYVEEASLYSIAEDSREGRASVLSSRQGDIDSVRGGGAPPVPSVDKPIRMEHNVEVEWAEAAFKPEWDDDLSTDASEDFGSPPPSPTPGYASSSRRRKLLTAGVLLLVVVVAVALGTSLPKNKAAGSSTDNNDTNVGSDVSNVTQTDVADSVPPGGEDTTGSTVEDRDYSTEQNDFNLDEVEGVSTNTKEENDFDLDDLEGGELHQQSPEEESAAMEVLVQNYVLSTIMACSDEDEVMDSSTMQNEVFRALVSEVMTQTTRMDDFNIDIPIEMGPAYLAERWALSMFYKSMGGDQWLNNESWLSGEDVCFWHGIDACAPRNEGSCAALRLTLGEFGSARTAFERQCFLSLTHRLAPLVYRCQPALRSNTKGVLLHALSSGTDFAGQRHSRQRAVLYHGLELAVP